MNERGKGQPRAFKDNKEFKDTFDKYIDHCMSNEYLPNIAGFCVFADINRDTYYMQKEYYPDTFKQVENLLEDKAINAKINDTFKIFYLKNKFNYRDRQEIDNTNLNIELKEEDKELLETIKKRLDEK